MAGEAHVLVACGGSGIQTLTRLNGLLSQDYYWRRRIPSHIFYVVVDTDVDEMRNFELAVRADLQGVSDRPFITAVQLSHGETHLQPLVNRHMLEPFRGGRNTEGRDRLLAHWWNRGPNDPFFAPKVNPITDGAGQCPPVSYLLTWKALKPLEDQFDRLFKEIQRRNNGFGRDDRLNLIMIAGLAGGTGRGSWELIAFKLRELFLKKDLTPTPRAFLFDSSIFQNVFGHRPEQKEAMEINSLTGVSQLSCWIENRNVGHTQRASSYAYQLPSLTNPGDPATDVLSVDLEVDVNNAAPVNHAYLIFNENGVANLADNVQYYEMAGAGIYAALSKSSILRQAINSPFPLVGLATSTYEVNAAAIRRYFEAQARFYAARSLAQSDDKQVDDKVTQFFKQTNLRIDVTDSDPVTFLRAEPRGLLLQRVLVTLEAKSANRLAAMEQALNDDNLEEARRLVRGLMANRDDLVQQSFKETLEKECLDPALTASHLARELFEHTKSASAVRTFFERVQAGLEEEYLELPSEISLGRESPIELVESLSTRSIPILGRRFDAAERQQVMDAIRRCVPRANFKAIREEIETRYKKWSREIDRFLENARDVLQCLGRLEQKFARERDVTVDGQGEAFRRLFTNSEFPESSLERFSARKFYRRELPPVLAEGEDLQLLAKEIELSREVFDVVFQALCRERDFSETEAFDVRKRLEKKLEQAIESTVGLPDHFMTENFSIRHVIKGLKQAWHTRLRGKLSQDVRNNLEGRFEELFGFRPKMAQSGGETEYDLPDLEDMIFQMGASLARTCKPYWKLRGDQTRDFHVDVFVPTEHDKETATNKIREFLADEGIHVEAYIERLMPDAAGEYTANPFLILAYSTEGTRCVADIESLDYYKSPEILNTLKATEEPTGKTIFEGALNGGIGYVDPLYVRDETIRSLRWRPWYTQDGLRDRDENHALDALLYALFPGETGNSESLLKLQKDLRQVGWEMPLVHCKKGNRYAFTRLPLEYSDRRGHTDQQTQNLTGWDKGKAVASNAGLHNVLEVLSSSDPVKQAWRTRILRESETFWSTVLHDFNLISGMPAYKKLWEDYTVWLGEMSRNTDADDSNHDVWNKLLARAHARTK